ncbi:MAG TPA: carboxypeptidase-like regulatory domain-containing protein, partial [Candidatus Sulfotelmatobacter sp.]|nr:carboxypeptidase-like regulatory domain-containing protein [Candidatus Sulfotelmatobacter sp.]
MNQVTELQLKSVCCRSIFGAAILSAVLLLAAGFAEAQSTGGRIRGTVTDPSGGAIAGVTVTLINTATNTARNATTGGTGEYLFLEVPVGIYEIDVTQTGFKKFVHKDITVDLNAVVSVDITLQVGGGTETVEVTGEPPVVDTSSTQLGAVVNERSSTQLPLNQRDV